MAAQHTPGPWAVHPQAAYVVPAEHIGRKLGGAEDLAYDLATYAQEICAMHHPDPHRSEAEVRANAALIAAAPDLLVQLNGLLSLAKFIISAADIDADLTTVVLRNKGVPVAEVPISTLLTNAQAAIDTAEGR